MTAELPKKCVNCRDYQRKMPGPEGKPKDKRAYGWCRRGEALVHGQRTGPTRCYVQKALGNWSS